jgi:isocitrate dehydrogenase
MKILKYIITDKKEPVIFSSNIQHDAILKTCISAGFLIVKYDVVNDKFIAKCFGESDSLNLKSETKDILVIENYLNDSFVLDAK